MELAGLSSMATKALLADLSAELGRTSELTLRFESGGGVAVARQVREGAAADVLVLADDAMRQLEAEDLVMAGTLQPLFLSSVVAAVPAGRPTPPFATEDDVRALLSAVTRVGYSTGPSGSALRALVDRWGLTGELEGRFVQAPPGVPVGSLVASGEVDLGFQQHSELMDVEGITLLGPLPGDAAITSTFSGGVLASSAHPDSALRALAFLSSDHAAPFVHARGMSPA